MDNTYVGKKVTIQKIDEPDKTYFGKVILYRYLGINHFIPKEYQEVEWIGSSGTQWFDTGVIIEKQTQIEIWVTQATNTSVLGVKDSSTSTYWGITGSSSYSRFDYQDSTKTISGIQGVNTQIPYTDFVKYTVLGKSIKVNDVLYFQSSSTEWHTTEYTLPLFCRCNKKVYNDYLTGQIKRCIITNTNNNTILRDFIPCYNKSSNVIGMYDRVNGIFYTNRGTGTFTKGNDVNNDTDNFISYISCPALGHNLIITDENESEYNIKIIETEWITVLDKQSNWGQYTIQSNSSSAHGKVGMTSSPTYYYRSSTTRISTIGEDFTGELGTYSVNPAYKLNGAKRVSIKCKEGYKFGLMFHNEEVTTSSIPYSLGDNISEAVEECSSWSWMNVLLGKESNTSISPEEFSNIEIKISYKEGTTDTLLLNSTLGTPSLSNTINKEVD